MGNSPILARMSDRASLVQIEENVQEDALILYLDGANVDRYYHLHESRIPVQKSEPAVIAKFIETLLILRNILIVNMSLLPHGSTPKSDR
ncbi:hypothetical protein GLOIN_2v1489056 [Rhizophagus clarus]|uniref:Uncharacterized protein n=1 Tax=Rhizophagus clarus TaxID=94130 RepID=A0A8H3ME01_9GLOM|nr:hypothetical protein GLOIN_2v1489056 [Rhizophagus clarus]